MKNYEPMTVEFRPMSEFPMGGPYEEQFNFVMDSGLVTCLTRGYVKGLIERNTSACKLFAPLQKPVVKAKYCVQHREWHVELCDVLQYGTGRAVAVGLSQAQAEAVAKTLNEMEENQ
jgi:hypothetical protein